MPARSADRTHTAASRPAKTATNGRREVQAAHRLPARMAHIIPFPGAVPRLEGERVVPQW